jgi:hypothetical protein
MIHLGKVGGGLCLPQKKSKRERTGARNEPNRTGDIYYAKRGTNTCSPNFTAVFYGCAIKKVYIARISGFGKNFFRAVLRELSVAARNVLNVTESEIKWRGTPPGGGTSPGPLKYNLLKYLLEVQEHHAPAGGV